MWLNGVPIGIDHHASRGAKLWEQGSELHLLTEQFDLERRNDVDVQTASDDYPVLGIGCHAAGLTERVSAFRPERVFRSSDTRIPSSRRAHRRAIHRSYTGASLRREGPVLLNALF